MITDESVKPFLKWAGGKRWLVANHRNLFPIRFKRYIEPFLGSGAVFFSLSPQQAVLSDKNKELIDIYRALREWPDQVWRYLLSHKRNHCEEYYYRVRSSKPRSVAGRAAKFIYLNRTCFNGLYRVNYVGQFNVPKGTKDTVTFPDDSFVAVSRRLKCCKLYARDFEQVLASANDGDFVYVDPTYTVKHNNNNFLKYNEKLFSWHDQERLAKVLTEISRRGAIVVVSNANHPCIRKLYSPEHWVTHTANRHSILASHSADRKPTTELIISNYCKDIDKDR